MATTVNMSSVIVTESVSVVTTVNSYGINDHTHGQTVNLSVHYCDGVKKHGHNITVN